MGFEAPNNNSLNRLFDRYYELLEIVGRGKSSVVYKARKLANVSVDDPSEGIVALKVLTGNSKQPELNLLRMEREALALLSSRHEHVVRLNDYVTTGELCYLSMEYAERGDLGKLLDRSIEPFSPELVLRLISQLLAGLEAIHRSGIIHRDIKPENLLLMKNGVLRIADFGIALLASDTHDPDDASRGVGTLDYMAPESLEYGISSQSMDIYAVGVTLYKLLTNKLPFSGSSFAAQIEQKLSGERMPLSHYIANDSNPLIELLLDRSLARNPDDRFQSAIEFKEAVDCVISGRKPNIKSLKQMGYGSGSYRTQGLGSGKYSTTSSHALIGKVTELAQGVLHTIAPYAKKIIPVAKKSFVFSLNAFLQLPRKVQLASGALVLASILGLVLIDSGNNENQSFARPAEDVIAQEAPVPVEKEGFSSLVDAGEKLLDSVVTEVGKSQEKVTFATLVGQTHLGVLYQYTSGGGDMPFVAKDSADGIQLVFATPGGKKTIVHANELAKNTEITVQGVNSSVSLSLDSEKSEREGILQGKYVDKTSGKAGIWTMLQ
jgi:serine/threonine protein kinase